MSAEVVVVPTILSSVVPALLPVLGLLITAGVVNNAVNNIRRSNLAEKERERMEMELRRIQQEQEKLRNKERLLKAAQQFKNSDEFVKWFSSEVLKYKELEGSFIREIEKIKVELEEKEKKLKSDCNLLISSIEKVDSSLAESLRVKVEELKDLDSLENQKKFIEEKANFIINDLSEKARKMSTNIQGEIGKSIIEISNLIQELKNSKKDTHRKLNEVYLSYKKLEDLLEEYKSVKKNTKGVVAYTSSQEAIKSYVSKKHSNIKEEILNEISNTNLKNDIIEIKQRIEDTLELLAKLSYEKYQSIMKQIANYKSSNDKFYLENILTEVRIQYGTIKMEILEDRAYRELIRSVKDSYKDYESVQRLSDDILSKELIKDKDYKKFIEELVLIATKDEIDKRIANQKISAVKDVLKKLQEKGYEIYLDEESFPVENIDELENVISNNGIIEISPSYSHNHFVKMKLNSNGNIAFKFFTEEGTSKDTHQEDINVSKQWCNDFKEVISEIEAPLEIKHIVEPEEVSTFPKAKSFRNACRQKQSERQIKRNYKEKI